MRDFFPFLLFFLFENLPHSSGQQATAFNEHTEMALSAVRPCLGDAKIFGKTLL
jgi:hypothetical protein